MITLKFSVLAQYCCILAGLFLISAKNMDTNEPGVIGKTLIASADGDYEIVLFEKTTDDSSKIVIYKRNTTTTPDTNMTFFIILPDGNYIYLNKKSKAYSTSVIYSTKVKFQNLSNTGITLNINNMQGWAMKKNEPIPPSKNHSPRDEPNNPTNNNYPNASLSNTYLSKNESIKIGTSWSPWDDPQAYYYLIISYTNTTGSPQDGNLEVLIPTLDQTGFSPESTLSYFDPSLGNLINTSSIPTNTIINTLGTNLLVFNFKNLKQNEVRHLYVKMKKNITELTIPGNKAIFKAKLNFIIDTDIRTEVSPEKTVLVSTAPHDPNKKIVDQNGCTANGSGILTYTIIFQNEGKGVATNVIVKDTLPLSFYPYHVSPLEFSHSRTSTSISPDGVITFEFKNIDLPGSAQTNPRIYDYNETIGWVKFSCAVTCPDKGQAIKNRAAIIFEGTNPVDSSIYQQPAIITENISTVADTTLRPTWPVVAPRPCIPKHCHSIGGRRCRLYFCLFRRCKQCTDAKPKK